MSGLLSHLPQEATETSLSTCQRHLLWGASMAMTTLSLVGSSLVLHRVRKRKPLGVFVNHNQLNGPSPPSRLFDTLVRES